MIDNFLRPVVRDSPLYEPHTKNGLLVFGLVLGTVLALAGIAIAYRVWVARPGTAAGAAGAPAGAVRAARATSGTSTS